MKFTAKFLPLFLSLFTWGRTIAQQANGVAGIEKLYEEKNYTAAEKLLNAAVENIVKAKNADSLVKYIIWTGKINSQLQNENKALQLANTLINKIKSFTTTPETLSQAYIEIGEFYGLLSQNEMGFKSNEKALAYAVNAQDANRPLRLANIENNMSTYAQRMGDISLSIVHGRNALRWLNQLKQPDYEKAYLIYNSIGAGLYYQSKLDSGIYFFNKALEALSKAQPTPENRFYRPAIIQNNIAGIYGIQGKATAGIAAMKSTIDNLKKFVATKEPHKKKANALAFQFEATDNLAGIYKDLGDYRQAQQLLLYSYEQKKKQQPQNYRAVFTSEVLLGQLYFAMREIDKSIQYINTGIANMAKSNDDNLFLQADAYSTLALIYEEKKDIVKATLFYEKADSLYEESLQGEYDNIYLQFLTSAATFYAASGQAATAIAKANKGYNYIAKTEGLKSLSASQQLLNLSEVYYRLKDYKQALSYSNKSLAVLNASIHNSESLLDSVKVSSRKPRAILIKAKATYELLPQKSVMALTAILQDLNSALTLLEQKKAIIDDAENNSLLLADNTDLLEFIKKVSYELYKLTNDAKYIDRLVGLHESGMYNRIRSRLDANDSLQFVNVPKDAQATEKKLKAAIATALQSEGTHDDRMKRYLDAVNEWNTYQETLRKNYPKYYAMRYASVFRDGNNLQQTIPKGVTIVRYFYIDKNLYAFIADAQKKQLYALQQNTVDSAIEKLAQYQQDALKTGEFLHHLYLQLWAPFADQIRQPNVVIIPDKNLYNLSFETLTPERINSFDQLATKSLMAKYAISYHYSLLLLNEKENGIPKGNFVAFAPGFSDEIKNQYRKTLKETEAGDRDYLRLLPQPFTVNLVNKFSQFFGGKLYTEDASTASNFRQNAGQHKIIHIGTHAEADNLHPQFSRLIFTKESNEKEDENSLFLSDLYNCDLTSELTVLTACETGRPGYKDGEGMISLAHAFNYAGSQSILTSLWKIDEQASAAITEIFYENLSKGLAKSEALRQAKLYYLSHNNGRMLSPQYWAGLVIMGDTTPLKIEKKSNTIWRWIGSGIVLLIGGTALLRKKYNHKGTKAQKV